VVLRRRWRHLPAKDVRAGRIRGRKSVLRYPALSNPLNTRDIAAMTPLLTDDFQFILRRGTSSTRKAILNPLSGDYAPGCPWGNEPPFVCTAEELYTTRLFVRQAGAWKMALQQATLISR
jgi:hypothetical protein